MALLATRFGMTARAFGVAVLLGVLGGGMVVWREAAPTDGVQGRVPLRASLATVSVAVDERAGHAIALGQQLAIVDLHNGTLLRITTVPNYLSGPLIVAANTNHAFVLSTLRRANASGTSVQMVDTRTGALVRTIRVPPGPFAGATCGGSVFIASTGPLRGDATAMGRGFVSMVDARDGSILRVARVGLSPSAVAADARAQRVFVANYGSGTVSVLDATTGRTLRTVPVGVHPTGIAVDDRTGRAFVTDEGSTSVSMLDTTSGRVLRTISAGNPLSIAVDAVAGRVVVVGATRGVGTVTLLDARGGAVLRTIPLDGFPIGALALSARGNLAFVATTGARTGLSRTIFGTNDGVHIQALSTSRGVLLRMIRVDDVGRNGLAVDERSGRLLVLNPKTDSMDFYTVP